MNSFQNKKIGVLMGGLSQEREVSLRSGQAVLAALLKKGYAAVGIDVGRDVAAVLREQSIEVAWIALHGRYGEDGSIQGLLEILEIPYTGSSVLASSLAMDKYLTKDIARAAGLKTPQDYFIDHQWQSFEELALRADLKFPLIVKPSREGSTIGIQRVQNLDELRMAVAAAAKLDARVLIEEYIEGREVTVAMLGNEVFPIVEVKPKGGFYDFQAKYTAGATEYQCPADLSPGLEAQLQKAVQKIYRRISCEGIARADFMIDSELTPYFLEINTLPGMTATSLVPKAAQAAGLSFEDLVEKILLTARLKIA